MAAGGGGLVTECALRVRNRRFLRCSGLVNERYVTADEFVTRLRPWLRWITSRHPVGWGGRRRIPFTSRLSAPGHRPATHENGSGGPTIRGPTSTGVSPWGEAATSGRVLPTRTRQLTSQAPGGDITMALLTRARGIALAGVTALAVALPISPMAPAPAASAVPAPRVSVENSVAATVHDRRSQEEDLAQRALVRRPRLEGHAHRQLAQGRALPLRRLDPPWLRLLRLHLVRLPQGGREPAALGHRPDAQGAADLAQPGAPRRPGVLPQRRAAPTTSASTPGTTAPCTPRARVGASARSTSGRRNVSFGRVL